MEIKGTGQYRVVARNQMPLEPEDTLPDVWEGVWTLLPPSSGGKESACNAGDPALIPGSGTSPLQWGVSRCPAWRIPWTERGAWQATVHGVARVGHDLATKPPPPLS